LTGLTFVAKDVGYGCQVMTAGPDQNSDYCWTNGTYTSYDCSDGTNSYEIWTCGGVSLNLVLEGGETYPSGNKCGCGSWGTPNGGEVITTDSALNDVLDAHPEGFDDLGQHQSLASSAPGGGSSHEISGEKPTVYTTTNPTGNTTNTTGVDPVTGNSTGLTPVTTDTTGPAPVYGNVDQPTIPVFDSTVPDVPLEDLKEQVKSQYLGFWQNIPVFGAIYNLTQNIHFSSGACTLTFTVLGQQHSFNFCKYTDWYAIFRVLLESASTLYALLIIMGA
jgi:hypothetical protein